MPDRQWRRIGLLVVAFSAAAAAVTMTSLAVNVATGGSSPWFPALEARPLWWVAGMTTASAGAGLLGWWAQRLAHDTGKTVRSTTSGGRRDADPTGPGSWGNSSTDQTPFTVDALLPRLFSTDKAIKFARVAGGARPCHHAASGPGSLTASDVVRELNYRGCTQVMTGVYLECSSSITIARNPVLVAVTVFALPDTAAASDLYSYLSGPTGAVWNLTLWRTRRGVGSKPWTTGMNPGYRHQYTRFGQRYVVAAVAHRVDLSTDGRLKPRLESAAVAAAYCSGPQNHRRG
ncbi:hypothetical protein GA0074692_6278 [Micromonospora pallida]|uniref:Uncharacterized protein n=1 Tax=Micromonospora pallida TaxID=145854 RepID=A0A1C6TIG3_9ACTN|nr:hypothetical protein [Micromonospora pallida]SCL41362.1 hypothetical protein GA0074692_6278 [Micromonospora pallida]